eukprot:6487318-Amphidinium_carterae.1
MPPSPVCSWMARFIVRAQCNLGQGAQALDFNNLGIGGTSQACAHSLESEVAPKRSEGQIIRRLKDPISATSLLTAVPSPELPISSY